MTPTMFVLCAACGALWVIATACVVIGVHLGQISEELSQIRNAAADAEIEESIHLIESSGGSAKRIREALAP